MGNSSSCVYTKSSKPRAAILLHTDGTTLRQVKLPAKAAEIMLEAPGHVVSPADEMKKTHLISAMRADDEVVAGKLYVLVPVARAHSRASALELANIELAGAKKKSRSKKPSGSQVVPASMTEDQSEETEFRVLDRTGLNENQLGNNRRHWNPVLETIFEDL